MQEVFIAIPSLKAHHTAIVCHVFPRLSLLAEHEAVKFRKMH